MNTVTQKMLFRQSLIKYAEKKGVTKAAIKYNVSGGSVQVLLFSREGQVHLIVDDTGEGVPPEKLAHIFDRFYRVDESRTGEQSGSGLGLSIVLDAAEKNGGSVSAENREEGGMRFRVSFPALNKNG